jgi:hypothetical protein
LSILPLTDLITISNLKFFHKYFYNKAPAAFKNTWVTTIEHRQREGQIQLLYNLRNNDEIFVPQSRLAQFGHFPIYNLPSLWNNLPPDLRNIPTLGLFSKLVKTSLISNLSELPNCNRLICPACTRILQ